MKFALQNPTSQKYEYVDVDVEYSQCEYVYLYKYVYVSCTYQKERQPETQQNEEGQSRKICTLRKEKARRGNSRSWVQSEDCCCCCCCRARVAMAASTLKCGACSFVDAVVVKNAAASLRPSAAAAPAVSQVGSVAGAGGPPVWKSSSWAGVSLVARPSGEKKKMVKYVKRTVVSQAVSIETEKEVEHLNIAEDVTQVHLRFLLILFFLDAFGLLLLLVFCLFHNSERRQNSRL